MASEIAKDAPEWVHLLTTGQISARDGRRFTLDDPTSVISASIARSSQLVVDYEHQTDHAPKNGKPAPAAGWIKDLAVRADGIWGRIEWTDKAATMIRAREYRFLSPTFTHAKEAPHRIGLILRAALTNNPALGLIALATTQNDIAPGAPRYNASQLSAEEVAICKALNISEEAYVKTKNERVIDF